MVNLGNLSTKARKGWAAISIKRLDTAAQRYTLTREQSLHGTLKWLMRAQDSTADDGVSYGYSLYEGWSVSYPETTGYILQTFLWYYDLYGGEEIFERARRMAHWEADIQMGNGATPGNFGTRKPIPVAFNTGQVLLGWAEYLRRQNDSKIRDAAAKAGYWLVACMGDMPFFEGGLSDAADHGDLSYNSMISWGMAELARVLEDETLANAALRSASHYATLVNANNWPYRSGFSDADSEFPLTHTLGYTIQGFIETGRVLEDDALVQKGQKLLEAARNVIDTKTGFLPGRVRQNWNYGARWACLTGSAQFAYSLLRLELMGLGKSDYLDIATKLIDFVIGTQLPGTYGRPELAFGVRGSYPFSLNGYQAATQPNWAAKFLIDAEILLQQLGEL